MNSLRSFVIGSSLPVVVYFFLRVAKIPKDVRNYSYEQYTIIAPLYFGLMNMISLYVFSSSKPNIERFATFGLLSGLIVFSVARSLKSYNMSSEEWTRYAFRILMTHILAWMVIYFLESNV